MAALTEEQTILKDQAKAWASEQAPVAKFRQMRDSGVAERFEPATWQSMVELGWTGILVPESYGGSDLGYLTFGVVAEELGRQLSASPLLASALVGATAVLLGGDDAQKRSLLPGIVDGSEVLTLAVDEGPRHAPQLMTTQARREGSTARITGSKTFVLEGLAATTFIVPANADGDVQLFVVKADAEGVSRSAIHTMDSRGYAHVEFSNAEASGQLNGGQELLEAVLDRARAGLAAEMLGTAAQAFDMTLEYLKTREQFGRVIGSFQALGHRAAELFGGLELSRSAVEGALQAIDAGADNVPLLCSLSKAKVGEFLYAMSNDLIQIHGGIGMTDEFDAGLYFKRARVVEATYGNQAFHRDRYATLLGF